MSSDNRPLREARPLRPASMTRAPARLALRLLVATMPLLPSLAQADTTLPGSDGKSGGAQVTLMPQPIGNVRVTPPLPGTMPAPHLPPPPKVVRKTSLPTKKGDGT